MLREHGPDELSHYSSATSDIEYRFPMGWSELEGIANRGDYDLTRHAEFSGEKLEYFDQQKGEAYVPHVIEPSPGADRATLAFLVDAYDTEEVEGRSAPSSGSTGGWHPVKAAVLPLVSKAGMPERAREIYEQVRAGSRPSTTRVARSAAATAARTRSAPHGASPWTARPWRTAPSPCETATPWSRSVSPPRAWARASPQSWNNPGGPQSSA